MGSTRTFVISVIVAILVATAGAVVPVVAEAEAPAAAAISSPTAHAWAPEWMVKHTGDYTTAEARAIASRYDLVVAHEHVFEDHVGAMKAQNPNLKLLVYVNGPFAANYLPDYPESWYAHNAAGKRVHSVNFGNPLMNVHTSQWRAEVLRLCEDMMAGSGYDGCFLDSLGNGIIKSGYLDSDPIDPRTGQPWTIQQYIKDTSGIPAYLKSKLPGVPIMANGLGSGSRYFADGLEQLAAATDASMAEAWLRGAIADVTAWPKPTQWKQNVDMIADAEARGSGVLTVTKLWTTTTAAQRKQWYDYALGSFLLGTGGHSQFFFIKDGCKPPCNQPPSPLEDQWAPDGALGDPVGTYRAAGTAYVRDFTNGFVAVNPGESATTVTLPAGTFTDQDGATRSGSVSLGAHDGVRLLASPSSPTSTTSTSTSTSTTSTTTTTTPPDVGNPPEVGIDPVPGGTFLAGPVTVTGWASADSPVAEVTLQVKDASTGDWLQPDGTWAAQVEDLPAELNLPASPLVMWNRGWQPDPGRYYVYATGTDQNGIESAPAFADVQVDPPAPVVTCNEQVATIVGTSGDDELTGTSGPDVIVGLGGDDRITGLGGDDVICGGDGKDVIQGNAGDDWITGGAGEDLVVGGDGDDTIQGGGSDDRLEGRYGRDRVDGGNGADVVLGNQDDDTLFGGAGVDVCNGGAGGGDSSTQCETELHVE